MATVGPRTGPNAGAEALALEAELQGEAKCSICLEFFREPVSVESRHSRSSHELLGASWRGNRHGDPHAALPTVLPSVPGARSPQPAAAQPTAGHSGLAASELQAAPGRRRGTRNSCGGSRGSGCTVFPTRRAPETLLPR